VGGGEPSLRASGDCLDPEWVTTIAEVESFSRLDPLGVTTEADWREEVLLATRLDPPEGVTTVSPTSIVSESDMQTPEGLELESSPVNKVGFFGRRIRLATRWSMWLDLVPIEAGGGLDLPRC